MSWFSLDEPMVRLQSKEKEKKEEMIAEKYFT